MFDQLRCAARTIFRHPSASSHGCRPTSRTYRIMASESGRRRWSALGICCVVASAMAKTFSSSVAASVSFSADRPTLQILESALLRLVLHWSNHPGTISHLSTPVVVPPQPFFRKRPAPDGARHLHQAIAQQRNNNKQTCRQTGCTARLKLQATQEIARLDNWHAYQCIHIPISIAPYAFERVTMSAGSVESWSLCMARAMRTPARHREWVWEENYSLRWLPPSSQRS